MSKKWFVSILVFCLVCPVLAAAPAQARGKGFGNPTAKIMQSPAGHMFALADKLEITDEQLLNLRALFRTQRERMKDLRTQLREVGRKTRIAMRDGKLDELEILIPELSKQHGLRISYTLGFFLELRRTLTEAQWEKIRNLRLLRALKRQKNKLRQQKIRMHHRMKMHSRGPMMMPHPGMMKFRELQKKGERMGECKGKCKAEAKAMEECKGKCKAEAKAMGECKGKCKAKAKAMGECKGKCKAKAMTMGKGPGCCPSPHEFRKHPGAGDRHPMMHFWIKRLHNLMKSDGEPQRPSYSGPR